MKNEGKQILLATQKDKDDDDPAPDGIYDVGVVATVLQLLKLPDGTVKVLVEGRARAGVSRFTSQTEYYEAEIAYVAEDGAGSAEAEALSRAVVEQFENYVKLNKKVPPEALAAIPQIDNPGELADRIASHLSVKIAEKQQLLEVFNVVKRLEKVYALMEGEISVMQTEKKIRNRVKRQMEKTQREYYLNEQMKAIQRHELGAEQDVISATSCSNSKKRIKKTKLSKEAPHYKAESELKKPAQHAARRRRNPPSCGTILEAGCCRSRGARRRSSPSTCRRPRTSSKATTTRPGEGQGADPGVPGGAKPRGLAEGLDPVPSSARPASARPRLGRSIAKATGREFVRVSLGGVRDRGSRSAATGGHYIGSMLRQDHPVDEEGQVDQRLLPVGQEIDKMGSDWQGDPSSALLEVLDPAQNSTFADHYLEVDYDLSPVMFVTTANSLNMRPAADGPHGDHPHPRLHRGREAGDRQAAHPGQAGPRITG